MLRRAASSLLATCSSSSPAVCSGLRWSGTLPANVSDKDMPTITEGRQAFEGDLRSTSALGFGDGIYDHTGKWLQVRHACSMLVGNMLQHVAIFLHSWQSMNRTAAPLHSCQTASTSAST